MTRKRKTNESLLHRIISILDSSLKLLVHFFNLFWYYKKMTIPLTVLCVSISIAFIVNSDTSKDPLPSRPDVNDEGQIQKSDELDSEEPTPVKKIEEPGTRRTRHPGFSEDIKEIRGQVIEDKQHMEEMLDTAEETHEEVKELIEDAEKMNEEVKQMNEKLDGGSKD